MSFYDNNKISYVVYFDSLTVIFVAYYTINILFRDLFCPRNGPQNEPKLLEFGVWEGFRIQSRKITPKLLSFWVSQGPKKC